MSATITIDNRPCTPLEATRIADKLFTGGQIQPAGTIYSEVLKINPKQAEAHIGMGYVLLNYANWTEALYHATEARKHNPKLLKPYHLAILAMKNNLPTIKALTWCENGLKEHPQDSALLLQRALIHAELGEISSLLTCVDRIMATATPETTSNPITAIGLVQSLTPARTWEDLLTPYSQRRLHPITELSILTCRLISLWLNNQHELFQNLFNHSRHLFDQLMANENITYRNPEEGKVLTSSIANTGGYIGIFNYLEHNNIITTESEYPKLYMVGDSHTIPAHTQTVTIDKKPHQIESHLTMGCKLWHLANSQRFYRSRHLMQRILEQIPPASHLLISVGEIDTRANEGIWPLHLKTNKPLTSIIENTTTNALAWLQQHTLGHRVTIAGIPAPVESRHNNLFNSHEEKIRYAHMIRDMNHSLRTQAHAHNMNFLDLYSLTSSKDSPFSNSSWHMDDSRFENTHLKPKAIATAFTQYYHPAPSSL